MKTECFTNYFKLLLLALFLPIMGLAQNSPPCDDGDPNTIDIKDGEGNCIHIAKVCNDGKGTTITFTIPAGPECKDIPCDDNDPKTVDIVDINGECHHIQLGCDDGDPTTLDYVDENGQCVNEKIVCDDGDPETEDYLDANGVCHHVKTINNCNTCENDKTPPTADCAKELLVKLGNGGMVEIWPSEIDNGSFDECGDVSLSIDKSKFDCDDIGYHYVTLTVKDEAGNESTCKTKVKVTDPDNKCYDPCEPDITLPWAKCKDITVSLGDGGMVEIWPSEVDNGSKDDCSEVTLYLNKNKFDCDDLGWNSVQLYAKDKSGNRASCIAKVKVTDPYKKCYDPCVPDETKPWAECKEWIEVHLGDGGMVTIWPSEVDNGSKDDCSDVSLYIDKNKFDCDDLGDHFVTLTVKDKAGNKAYCKSKVIVKDPYNKCYDPCEPDKTKPWAECKEWIQVKLGTGGMVEIWPKEIDNGSMDDCSDVWLSLDKNKFGCDDIGMHTVTLTVKDKAGNKAYCKSQVKVTDPDNKCYDPCEPDNTKPWAECKEWIQVKLGTGGMVEIWPKEIDNGSKDDCSDVWLSLDKNKFGCDDIGMHTVTLTVKDKAGNKAYCKSQVKVTDPDNKCYDPCEPDNTKPWAECKEWIEVHLGDGGMVELWPKEIDNGSKDDCSDVWLSIDKNKFGCNDLGDHIVTLTVKDKAGNKAYCKSKVIVKDPYHKCDDPCKYDKIAPEASCKPVVHAKIGKDRVVYVDPAEVNNGSKDNCGDIWLSLSKNKFTCDELGWNRVVLTVKDKAGNTANCYSYIKVDDPYKYCYDACDPDTGRPWAKCKDEITVELGQDGYKNISVFDINDGSKDDCSEVWLTLDKTRFSCSDLGSQYVTLTVKDKADNKATCSTKVKVTDPKGVCSGNTCEPDKEAPIAKCLDITVELERNKKVEIKASDIDGGSFDQCGDVRLSIDNYKFNCDDLGVQYSELTVTDKSGNKAKCTAKVSVTDPEDYCKAKLNDCDPEKLEPCEISIVWYTCTTLKICIGKHELSNIIVDRDKKGYQNEDIDIKFDNLKGLTFYYDVEKYGLPKGFWIKSSNNCGKCDDPDNNDNDWVGDRCPNNKGAGKYYAIPKVPEACNKWEYGLLGYAENTKLQQQTGGFDTPISRPVTVEMAGPANFEQINIFPNPSTHKVFVKFDGFDQNDLKLLIYNATGEQLRSLKTMPANEPQDLGVDDMPSGLYYLRVVKPNGEFIAKEFVIKH